MLLTWILIRTYLYIFNFPKNSPLSTGVLDSAMQTPESHQPSASESVSKWFCCRESVVNLHGGCLTTINNEAMIPVYGIGLPCRKNEIQFCNYDIDITS